MKAVNYNDVGVIMHAKLSSNVLPTLDLHGVTMSADCKATYTISYRYC